MRKKRWLIVSAAAAMIVVGVLTAGIIVAQSADDSPEVSRLSAKVAEILGLDAETVDSAIEQAKNELRNEAVQAKLDAMVESGSITQEEADAYMAWIDSAPDVVGEFHEKGFHKGRFGGRNHHRRGHDRWRGLDNDDDDRGGDDRNDDDSDDDGDSA